MNGTAQSILPHFDVFSSPTQIVPHGAMTEASAGLGKSRLFALSPVVAAMKGLGDDSPAVASAPMDRVSGGDVVWTVAILGLAGFLSYQAGKAIAPSRSDETTWGWIGVPVGLFTGVVGLGVMGMVANNRKG